MNEKENPKPHKNSMRIIGAVLVVLIVLFLVAVFSSYLLSCYYSGKEQSSADYRLKELSTPVEVEEEEDEDVPISNLAQEWNSSTMVNSSFKIF